MADKPVTREEKYLAYLTGDYTGGLQKPITRTEKYLYELCLKGIGGDISPEEIKNAVNEYLEKNPVKPGATTEQAQKIEQNKTDVTSLKKETSSLKEDIDKLNEGGLVLKDEVIEEDISNWLVEHPEATTTVQDGSLTELKLSLTSRKRIAREYRTLQDALNDNVWDINTIIRTHGFSALDDGGAGTYMISSYNPNDGNPMYFDYAKGKYLVYIPENNEINIVALGAKRDGSSDCSVLLNKLFSTVHKTVSKRFYTLLIPCGIFRCDTPLIMNVIMNIKGTSSTRGTYVYEWNSEIYPKEKASILYFPFTSEGTALTVDISQNGTLNIKDVAFVSNTTEWKNAGFSTRPTIPYNPFTLSKRVNGVNGLNIEKSQCASIENCSFIGFSGYGLRTYSHNVHNCFVARCGSGIVNNKSDLMLLHCYITQCDNGIKAESHGVIWVNNTFIDQCVEHGVLSQNVEQTTLVANGCIIDHIGYAGIYIRNALNCNIDARVGRCGMYYAGKSDYSDLSEDEKRKAVSIYYGTLNTGNMRLDVYRRSISDDSTDKSILLPYVVFGGIYKNLVVTGLHSKDYKFFDNDNAVSNTTVYADDGVHTLS